MSVLLMLYISMSLLIAGYIYCKISNIFSQLLREISADDKFIQEVYLSFLLLSFIPVFNVMFLYYVYCNEMGVVNIIHNLYNQHNDDVGR